MSKEQRLVYAFKNFCAKGCGRAAVVSGLPSSFSHPDRLETSPSSAAAVPCDPLAAPAIALGLAHDDLVLGRLGCRAFRDRQSVLCRLVSTAASSGQDRGGIP